MTPKEQCITIALCVLGTQIPRALPFLVFSSKKPAPPYIRYLGNALPAAVFALLVVYCLKDVAFLQSPRHGLPEILGVLATVGLHLAFRQMMVSIAGGTAFYMALLRFVFSGG